MKRQPFQNAEVTQHRLLPPAERPPGKGRFHPEAAPTPLGARSPRPKAVPSVTLATSTCRNATEPPGAGGAGRGTRLASVCRKSGKSPPCTPILSPPPRAALKGVPSTGRTLLPALCPPRTLTRQREATRTQGRAMHTTPQSWRDCPPSREGCSWDRKRNNRTKQNKSLQVI